MDYTKIWDFIMERIPGNLVMRVVMDFESAVWETFQRVKPDVTLTGCCFHCIRAVWKMINELGLAPSYRRKKNTSRFLHQLLCLPFLPAEQIRSTFHEFRNIVIESHTIALHSLLEYMEDTWIEGHLWTPSSWSVFGLAIIGPTVILKDGIII